MMYGKFQMLKKSVALAIILTSGISLNAIAGGETYSIYLNKTLLFTRHVYAKNQMDIKTIELGKANYNDNLVIYYHGCAFDPKGRTIIIKDNQGQILKKWAFADVTEKGAMVIPVSEILDLEKTKAVSNASIHFYASNVLQKGRMLAPVMLSDNKKDVASREEDAGDDWPMWAVRILAFTVFSFVGLRI